MSQVIIPKKSTVSDKVPLAEDLQAGEMCVNLTDGIIYAKHTDGSIVNLTGALELHTHTISQIDGLQAAIDDANEIFIGGTAPNSSDYKFWLDTTDDTLTYHDGSSWVPISSAGGGGISEAPIDGEQYVRQDAGWVVVDIPEGYTTTDFNTDFNTKTTSDLTEGTNLYYTDARAQAAIGVSGDLAYDSGTGVISFSETYSSASEVKTAYELNTDTNAFTDAEQTKLSGVDTGATANSTDAFLLDRTNHTGSQEISTVTNLQTSLDDKLEDAPSDGTQYARLDGTWTEVEASGTSYSRITADYTASTGEYLYVDTTSAPINITLPATPADFDVVVIVDDNGQFAFNNVTILRNGNTLQNETNDLIIDNSYREVTCVYYNSTWNVFAQMAPRWPTPNQVKVDGPETGNEADEILLFINGWEPANSYNINVSGGTFTRTSDAIYWTLPSVGQDESHFINVEESGVDGTTSFTHEVTVFNIPTLADDSISVTDFSLNESNTGWSI